jgi:2-polyprenyl-3-methyl-5-hydroxy-6-metoxy-1,4-benzoquinol methylase
MSSSVKDHYAAHLAPLYTWMSGGAAAPRERFNALLRTLNLSPSHPGVTALDLGAGSGFQALPLAAAGYAVTAVDLSEILLAELAGEAAAANLPFPIRAALGDLRDLSRHVPIPAPELIVCMGDTLPHLPSLDDVVRLLADSAAALAPGGHLLLSFRDYTVARTGADRFIPVRSDADRIFTCFLDYGPDRIAVHDIVHTRTSAADTWRTAISVYEKLRLSPDFVRAQLAAASLTLTSDTSVNGLVTLAARRPIS